MGGSMGLRRRASTNAGGPCSATARNALPSNRYSTPNVALQIRVAFANILSNTGCRLPGELEMTFNTSAVAVCCSSASASSRVRASSCFFNSTTELGPLLMRGLGFVPVERPRVGLFAPLRDRVTSSAQSLVPSGQPSLSILTEPHDELAPVHSITSSAVIRGTDVTEYLAGSRGSLRLDVGGPDHLAPFLGFVGDEPSKVGGRTRKHRAA